MRRTTGEPITCQRHGDARLGGPLHLFAPDFAHPFDNELFGIATQHYSLEILDRHQQELSIVGAIHASVPLPEHRMRVLLNFEADGRLRSLEYKLLGDDLTDEIQLLADTAVFKIGKASAGFRRPRSEDYSFSIDTSAELRVRVIPGANEPRVTLARHNADVLLPRRRHLRREQFRRFPNRFFDVEVGLELGGDWQGRSDVLALPGTAALGHPVLARSAITGPSVLEAEISYGRATATASPLTSDGQPPLVLTAIVDAESPIFAAMPLLDVRDPHRLEVDQVVAFAEDVYDCFTRWGLPAVEGRQVRVGGQPR